MFQILQAPFLLVLMEPIHIDSSIFDQTDRRSQLPFAYWYFRVIKRSSKRQFQNNSDASLGLFNLSQVVFGILSIKLQSLSYLLLCFSTYSWYHLKILFLHLLPYFWKIRPYFLFLSQIEFQFSFYRYYFRFLAFWLEPWQ